MGDYFRYSVFDAVSVAVCLRLFISLSLSSKCACSLHKWFAIHYVYVCHVDWGTALDHFLRLNFQNYLVDIPHLVVNFFEFLYLFSVSIDACLISNIIY